MAVVTISRQFGCGESIFTNHLAGELGYWLFDRTLVNLAAEELEVNPELVERVDERAERRGLQAMLERLVSKTPPRRPEMLSEVVASPHVAGGRAIADRSARRGAADVSVREVSAAVRTVILELARRGNIIIVGRGAGSVLRNQPNLFKLRLIAPLEWRVSRIMEYSGVSEKMARVAVERTDRERAEYIRQQFGEDWDDPTGYHLVLNTGELGIEAAARVAAAAVRRFEKSLAAGPA